MRDLDSNKKKCTSSLKKMPNTNINTLSKNLKNTNINTSKKKVFEIDFQHTNTSQIHCEK